MAEPRFLHGKKHLPTAAATIARRHDSELVNFTDPATGERRHWFAVTHPDEQRLAALRGELLAAGIRVDRTH